MVSSFSGLGIRSNRAYQGLCCCPWHVKGLQLSAVAHLFLLEYSVSFMHYLLFDKEEYFSVKSSLKFIFCIAMCVLFNNIIKML